MSFSKVGCRYATDERGKPRPRRDRYNAAARKDVMAKRDAGKNPDPRRGRAAITVVALGLAATALFAAASWNNEFIYDDRVLILEQPRPESIVQVFEVFGERHWYNLPYYRPLPRFTMVAQKYLHGTVPLPYHLLNAILIGLAAVAAYALLRLPVFRLRAVPALLASAVFVLHPIASSTVYPICSGRETSLPTVLIAVTMYAYLRGGALWRGLSLVGLAASLLGKEQGAVVPLLFALADVLGLSPRPAERGVRDWIGRYIPVVAIVAVYALVRSRVFSGGGGEISVAVFDRPMGPLLSLLYALQSVFAPFARLVYEPRFEVWFSWPRQIVSTCVVAAVGVAFARASEATRRPILFWLGWFVVGLLPTANVLEQEARFDERYVFLSLLGVAAILATALSSAWDRSLPRRVGVSAAVGVAIVCAVISAGRGRAFANDVAFHERWLATDPDSAQAHLSLGEHYFEAGDLDEAWAHLEASIRLRPGNWGAHLLLGHILAWRGDLAGAVAQYDRSLEIMPDFAKTHSNLGLVLAMRGDFARAEEHSRRALELEPELPGGHFNYGFVLELEGKLSAAEDEYDRERFLDPSPLADAHVRTGNQLASQGRFDRAAAHFERALRADPDNVEARDALARLRRSAPRDLSTPRGRP